MGTSSTKNKKSNLDSYIPALLMSFTKINELKNYFQNPSKTGQLSKILESLINSIDLLDAYVYQFDKMKDKQMKEKDNNRIKDILLFILDTLHNELNNNNESQNNNNSDIKIDDTDEAESYKHFIDIYFKYNNSIIQDLFFGEEEIIKRCSICKKSKYNFYPLKMLNFDIHFYKEVYIDKLIKNYVKQEEKNLLCDICNKKADILCYNKIKKYPEILILSFDHNNMDKTIITYYLRLPIQDEEYILICFITKANENNEKDDNYNVFYREYNDKWFIYNVTKKEEKEIENIQIINKNPFITFYQKKITFYKILMSEYYKNLSLLFNSIRAIPKLAGNHIIDANKFDNYYIISKKYFNRLTKIFESEEKYKNDNIIFDSYDQVKNIKNIKNLNEDELQQNAKLFTERFKILNDEDLFKPEYDINKKSGLHYPKDFIIISENELDQMLNIFNIKINNIKNYLYKVLLGENYLFIKSNTNSNTYYVCYSLIFLFYVEKIFQFNEDKYFSREINLYIKNRGGIDYYFEERQLDSSIEMQQIIDKEKENIGRLININTSGTMINLNKFFFNNKNGNNNMQ